MPPALKYISYVGLLFLLVGCTKSFDYEEEVALSTGNTLVVKRSIKSERFGELGAGGGKLLEQHISFMLNGKQIEWRDDIPPVAINFSGNTLFAAAMPHTVSACIQHGSPSPPFVFYQYREEAWIKIAKEQFPDAIGVNLVYFGYGRPIESGERLTQKRKQEISEGLKLEIHPGIEWVTLAG